MICVLCHRRWCGSPLEVCPVLVIEVIRPSTRTIDLVEKVQDYARVGIPEYWVVDAERGEVIIHRLREGL
ncbi:MAG: Uma2 family endonuclease [Candidatus Bathyarchaeia archaeon]